MVGSFTRESPYRIYKRSWLAWLSYMKIKYSEQGLRVLRNKIRNFVVLSTHGSFIILPMWGLWIFPPVPPVSHARGLRRWRGDPGNKEEILTWPTHDHIRVIKKPTGQLITTDMKESWWKIMDKEVEWLPPGYWETLREVRYYSFDVLWFFYVVLRMYRAGGDLNRTLNWTDRW